MIFNRLLIVSFSVFSSLTLFSCASTAPKVDLPAGTDPLPKLTETETRLNLDLVKQYDQLSPGHFKEAQKALLEAHKKSEKGESSEKILEKVGEAMAQLQLVEENGEKNSAALNTVLSARVAAKTVNAQAAMPEEFRSTDEQLQKFGDDIEKHDFQVDSTKVSQLEGRYAALELAAIKSNALGGAHSLIQKAEKSDGKRKVPGTYSASQIQYDSASRSIEANRHNPEVYGTAVALANAGAQKLDQVLKTVIDSKTSEASAVQIYDQKQQLAAGQSSLKEANLKAQEAQIKADATAKEVANKEQTDSQSIQTLQGQNQKYADREALNQKIEQIKSQFDPAEAEVVRDGNKIIIRLKSMKFVTARFELTTSSLYTLQKVKEMISAVPVTRVVVEGHTDSVGTQSKNLELSQKRAEAVKKYFVAEKTLPENQLEAKGIGYERPLNSNKTKEGRATNRRVDVVIETTVTM